MTTIDHAPAQAPTLVIIRGNSGSGKSTIAAEVRRHYGRGCALIEQDYNWPCEDFYEILHEQAEIAEGVIRILVKRLRDADAAV